MIGAWTLPQLRYARRAGTRVPPHRSGLETLMMVVGVDPHKQTRTAVAADELGRKTAQRTVRARRDGHRELIAWARGVAPPGGCGRWRTCGTWPAG